MFDITDMEIKKPHILIVEDDTEMHRTLSDILQEEGYEVKTARRGKEALALTAKEKFPICLIDLRLPDISGIEVLEKVKHINPETYAVIITAFASKETAIEALKAGAYYYIEKPVNMEELLHVIKKTSESYQLQEEKKRYTKELERANRELDDFTSTISHDLKAPLYSIHAFIMLLMEDYANSLDEAGRGYLNKVKEAVERMNVLIEDLLTLSRVGRKFTEVETVDLNELLKEIKTDLSAQIRERGGEVIAGKLPSISTQRVWVKQLFTNLVGNGLKFNKSAKPTVKVGCEEREKDYLFTVKDNGIGIEDKHLDSIFNLFERLHSSSEYEGTGAGLAICKKIAEELAGGLWVESKPGEGSTFFFNIPTKNC